MAIKLRTQSVVARAPQELCFEVVAAAGRMVEEISSTERIVEFKTSHRGREVVTLERLRLESPARIDYEWVEGPLPEVLEAIVFTRDDDHTRITYQGTFDVNGGPLARVLAHLFIKPSFNRIVLEHLKEAKQVAERRARRSHVHRPTRTEADQDQSRIGGTT